MSDLKPFEIQKFGGLNTVDDPLEFGWAQATAAQNVMPTKGLLSLREGTIEFADLSCDSFQGPVAWSSVDGSSTFFLTFCKTNSTKTCTLKTVTGAGAVATVGGAWTGSTEAPTITSVARTGSPTYSTVFIASVDSSTRIRAKYWNSVSNSGNVADMSTSMKPRYLAFTPLSNRLAAANFAATGDSPSGANGYPSTVFFSNAGVPDTFGANNYVHLAPGDGEQITGMVAYKDFLFVFKESKFFVFYGETIGPDGSTPEFNYRTVNIPVGMVKRNGGLGTSSIAAGRDGVYFEAGNRLYVTDGGLPRWVTERLWVAEGPFDSSNVTASDEFVYWEPDTTADAVYVYQTEEGWWTKWTTVKAPVGMDGVYVHGLTASGGGDQDFLVKRSSAAVADCLASGANGTPIEWSYTTGRQEFSPAGSEGVLREVMFDGVATFNVVVYDDGGSTTSAASLTATAGTAGRFRKACRGRSLKLQISRPGATAASCSLNRVVGLVLPGRPVGAS